MTADTVTSYDDLTALREGAIVTLKGRAALVPSSHTPHKGALAIHMNFADWSMVYIGLAEPVAVFPTGRQVTLKARVIDEDGTLEAIAVWEPGGSPIPLARDAQDWN